jgi:hypothetical protein
MKKAEFILSEKRFRISYDPEQVSENAIREKVSSVSMGEEPYRVYDWNDLEQ